MSKELNRRRFHAILASAASVLAAMACAGPAYAAQAITSFEVTSSTTQAGGHPDLGAVFSLASPGEPEAVKEVSVNLPRGVFGNPNAVVPCKSADFALTQCPFTSQVGLATIRGNYEGNPNFILGVAPIFNLEPRTVEETARFGFVTPTVNVPISIPIAVRTGSDYGLRMSVAQISQQIPWSFGHIRIWGFPSSDAHNDERFPVGSPGAPAGCPGLSEPEGDCIEPTPRRSPLPLQPLIDNPTVCTGVPLPVSVTVRTHQDPNNPSQAVDEYPPTTGCENQTFNPVLNLELTTDETDSAAGLHMQLRAPQFLGLANSPSTIRSVQLTLPEGLSINPDAADGQSACSDALANFGSESPASCPDGAKIGNFQILTPALSGPLTGSLYFGEPKPGDQYRVFMIASGFGINAKLVSSLHPDPITGQLVIDVLDLPQVPFEEFNMQLFASQRGLVATPIHCRVYDVDSIFTPWNSALAPQHSQPLLSLTSGPNGRPCPGPIRPFAPRLVAGMSNPVAGAFSNFHLKLDRDDGDQFLGDLNFKLPPGFTGDLRGISFCPEAAIAAAAQKLGRAEQAGASCPASSQIGTTNVAAGPGSHPFHAVGKMYLAGPLKGAPLSLATITPALAGPFDYGTVVVRVALHVDPLTAQVSAISDRVPSIIGGVPIRMRSIQVNIDRDRFTINPTNCSPFSIDSQGIGDQGTVTDFSSYFHAVNCRSLGFAPTMKVTRLGRKETKRSGNPRLRFDLRTRPGDANVKSVSVTLPNAFSVDQTHLGNICSEKELLATKCAGRSAIGTATTTTPLLDQPLSGPVYAVSGSGGLPRLAFLLDGEVSLVPRADTRAVKNGLETIVPVVPDAPIGHFRLTLFGGKRGYLINSRDICHRPPVIKVRFIGQNGKVRNLQTKIVGPCGTTKPRKL